MKTLKHLFAVLLLLCATVATAHDFEVGGIYYNILSKVDKTVEVSYKGNSYSSYSNEYTGSVVIPSTVVNAETNTNVVKTYSAWTSTNKSNSSTSQISYTLNVEAGYVLNFDWSVSSENNYDWLTITLGGTEIVKKSGTQSGSYEKIFDSAGTYTLTVKYAKDSSQSSGNDEGKIYNITLSSTAVAEVVYRVTSIGQYAFYNCTGLTSIEIPNSVTSIGVDAFYDCSGLTSIEIPGSVTSIARSAFNKCSGLEEIVVAGENTVYDSRNNCNAIIETATNTLLIGFQNTVIPNSVTSIGSYAFYYCTGLTNIVIPNSVVSVGDNAFMSCSGLVGIEIPSSLTSIGSRAFADCPALTSIAVHSGNTVYDCRDNCNAIIETATNTLIVGCKNSIIPNSVTGIGASAFYGCTGLSSLEIPSSVTSIGTNAFTNCSRLKTLINFSKHISITSESGYQASDGKVISAPDGFSEGDYVWFESEGVYTLACYLGNDTVLALPADYNGKNYVIGDYAFSYCRSLVGVTIPDGVTNIGDYAFSYCDDLSGEFIIPGSVKKIGASAFSNCVKISSAKILNGVEIIGDGAFASCRFGSITIPASMKSIGNQAFFNVPVREVVFEDGDGELLLGNNKYSDGVGGGLFEDCPVEWVYIGRNLAFSSANSSYNKLSTNALFSKWWASSYSTLATAIIGPKVTSLPKYLFEDCKELKTVISCIPADKLCSFDKTAEQFLPENAVLYVPINAAETYSVAKDWDAFGTIKEFAESDGVLYRIISEENASVEVVGSMGIINSLTIPEQITIVDKVYNVTSIGSNAFKGCRELQEVMIPNGVTAIGEGAFCDCSALQSIEIPGSVAYIGDNAFDNTLWSSELPEGLVYVGSVLYEYKGTMPANTSITVKEGTTGIASAAFKYCSNLVGIEIPNSVTYIGKEAFFYCTGLTSIDIPGSVTSIGASAFYFCSNLASVNINDIADWCEIDFVNNASNPLCNASLYLNGELTTNIVIPDGVAEIKNYAFCSYDALTSIEIPNSVTSIGDEAFEDCTGLTSIEIPNSVTSIGSYAFYWCSGLTNVVIGNSVTSIGSYAFYWCSGLTNVVIGNSVTSIGDEAFNYCGSLVSVHISDIAAWCNIDFADYDSNPLYNGAKLYLNGELLTKLFVPDGVAEIKSYAFYNNDALEQVLVGNGIATIGKEAFKGCDNLRTVINLSDLTLDSYGTSNGYISYYADDIINAPNGIIVDDFIFSTVNGKHTLAYYLGGAEQLVLPADFNGEKYKIGANAFRYNTTIASIAIPAGVESIGTDAFYGCSKLKKVLNISSLSITKGSTSNGYVAYYADEVEVISSGDLVGDFVFKTIDGTHTLVRFLLSPYIVKTFESDESSASFEVEVKKNDVMILERTCNDGVSVSIRGDSETGNLYEYLNFEYGMEQLIYTFTTSGKYKLSISNYMSQKIVGNIVRQDSIKLVLPDSYKGDDYVIAENVFKDNVNITSVTIPKSVASIGDYVFNGCISLKELIIGDGEGVLALGYNKNNKSSYDSGRGLFYDCPLEVLYLGRDLSYDTSYYCGYSPFYKSTLKSVTVGNSVTSIGDDAFFHCTGLEEVHINDIAAWCNIDFGGDYGANPLCYADRLYLNGQLVTELVIPDSVVGIKSYAFQYCSALTSVVIGDGVTSIGGSAFENCTGLANLVIGDGVARISSTAFENCSSLASIVVAEENTVYDSRNSCNAIIETATNTLVSGCQNTVIPDGVTGIGSYAFYGCSALADIVIPSSVKSIAYYAFYNCKGLANVTSLIPADELFTLNSSAFYDVDKNSCTLYVPYGAKDTYASTAGWSGFKNIVEMRSAYKATFSIDGEVIAVYDIKEGDAIVYPDVDEKEGCTFAWTTLLDIMPSEDIVIEGAFIVNTYTVTYTVDGEYYATDSIAYGSGVILRDEPAKEGYSFSGWSEAPETMPANDIVIEGTFIANTYTVTYTVDNEIYATDSIVYGNEIVLRDEPAKEGYTFSGWSEVPETMPANDIVIEGTFSVNTYTVTYTVDNEIYATDSIAYGSEIVLRDEPAKEGYTFGGWSEVPETMPANDIVIEGTFSVNTYTVTYTVDGEIYATDSIVYGNEIVLRDEPSKDGFTFSGWSETPKTMPANDIVIEGTFSVNSYTITFVVDGEVYKSMGVEYGAEIPTVEQPVKDGREFSGWSEMPSTMPAEDITIEGRFCYTVIFMADGKYYHSSEVYYGNEVEVPSEAPLKEGYTFVGWGDFPDVMPARDMTIHAIFSVNKYQLIFIIDGEVYETLYVEYGSEIEYPQREGYVISWEMENLPQTMPAEKMIIIGTSALDTAVECVKDDNEKIVYTLDGHRILDVENLEEGIYIIDGKKVFVK